MTLNISIVIPCYRPHIPNLKTIFSNICDQTRLPIEVILSISEISLFEQTEIYDNYINLFQDKKIIFKIISTHLQRNPGINRNHGAEIASGDYIMFVDADDVIHPRKIEITHHYIQLYQPNILLHKLLLKYPNDKFMNYPINIQNIKIYHNQELYEDTFGNPGIRNRKKEITRKKGGHSIGIKNPAKKFDYCNVTHGYATVKKELFKNYKYTHLARGEDGVFIRDILWNLGGVILLDVPLLNYFPSKNK